ncbi:MAG: hypothetical protein WBP55_07705 [Solirubrobacterales bacterium]
MSEEETTPPNSADAASPQGDPGGPPPLTPEEQEMLEQQMSEVRVEDLLTQTVASVLNLSARRIVKEDEIDLDQARIGIDAVRALVALLPAEVEEAVREPLSQVQMLYAQRAGTPPEGAPEAPGQAPPAPQQEAKPKGPGLWTPGRD